jgi:S-(hydroxymethyl)glutathione dehydrogenase/alcohol dehydrogenase
MVKADVFHGPKQEIIIEEIQLDKPGPREIVVKTVAVGVCHSDLHFVDGLYPMGAPAVLGHEPAGIVEEVGSQVTYVKPGDHVIACLSVFCGVCEYCMSGRPSLCNSQDTKRQPGEPPRLSQNGAPVVQGLNLAAYADKMLLHENAVVKIREDMPLDKAALIGCGVTTGVAAVLYTANVPAGSSVAVFGSGGVGLAAIQWAHIAGARMVIAVDAMENKLAMARQLGATHVVDASSKDAALSILEITGGGVEYAFEAVGLKVTAEQAFRSLAAGGTATIIGMIPMGATIELPGMQFMQEKKIQGSTMGSNRFRIDMPRYIDLYMQGRLKLDEMVSRKGRLEDVNDAFRAMKAGEVARTVLMFD